MKGNNLQRAAAAALWIGLILGLAGTVWAGDRRVGILTFESSAAHTAGTEYSSGFLVSSYVEGVILVNVSSVTGTPTLDLTVETSDDNTTFYHLQDIDQIRVTCTAAFPITNFGKYLRIKQVIAGSTSMMYVIKGVFKN